MPCVANWLSRITSGNGTSSERGTILETVPRVGLYMLKTAGSLQFKTYAHL